jgi:hypothetical protein
VTTLDYSALSSPVTRRDLKEFRDAPGVTMPHLSGSSAILAVLAAVLIGALALLVLWQVVSALFGMDRLDGLPLPLLLLLAAGVVITGVVMRHRVTRVRYLRLYRFAVANDLTLATNTEVPDYPGTIFGIGSDRTISERLSRSSAPAVDVGDLRYTTGSGKNRTTHEWGYVAIRLDRMLPQMVLDAKANNFLGTNLPVSFSRGQVLGLEGDFDRYFTLYCPKEYESDALYVFTPDLMARLVDEAALLDVEIVDDWMFLYSARPFDLADAATLARVFRIVDTVGAKTLDRTERYADSRVADAGKAANAGSVLGARMAANVVAPEGRRLQRGVSVVTIAVFVAVAIYAVLSFLPGFGD